jgi:hypothetical protein
MGLAAPSANTLDSVEFRIFCPKTLQYEFVFSPAGCWQAAGNHERHPGNMSSMPRDRLVWTNTATIFGGHWPPQMNTRPDRLFHENANQASRLSGPPDRSSIVDRFKRLE